MAISRAFCEIREFQLDLEDQEHSEFVLNLREELTFAGW